MGLKKAWSGVCDKMKRMGRQISLATAVVLLAACNRGGSAPQGQVVATVNGHEITTSQLRLEVGNAPSDPAAAAAAQNAALQTLINRQLLVDEARRRGVDKSPMAAMVKQRAEDLALVQLLQMGLAQGVPTVSNDDIKAFIDSHPSSFSDRKLISVDQVVVPSIKTEIVKQMQPLNTMDEVLALLNKNNVRYVNSAAVLDTVNMDPTAASKILALGPNSVFITPAGMGGINVSHISGLRAAPLSGEEANMAARLMLTQQRSKAQVGQALEEIVKAGQSKVKINPAYLPKGGQPAATQTPVAANAEAPPAAAN